MIPYGKQHIDDDDIKAVIEVLKSNWLTQGSKINEFEEKVAKKVDARFAVACSSGTAALHLACLAAGFGKDDIVLTSAITFLASANCARYVGANVDLIDVNPDTICLDHRLFADYLDNSKKKEFIKGIIPVHFAGIPCHMPEIFELAKQHQIVVIEDACHSLGAFYNYDDEDIFVGSCRHSDMTVFSFHPVKHITTGEGGMITTNNEDFYNKLLLFRSHGTTKDPDKFINKNFAFDNSSLSSSQLPNPWYYEMHCLGFNYRITDIQCALGISQLEKVDSFIQRRKEIVNKYLTAFKDNEYIKTLKPDGNIFPSWHLFPVQFDLDKIQLSRGDIVNEYHKNKIGVQIHYIPLYYQPYYKNLYEFDSKQYKNSEKYYESCVSLPLFPALPDKDIERVIDITFKIINRKKSC